MESALTRSPHKTGAIIASSTFAFIVDFKCFGATFVKGFAEVICWRCAGAEGIHAHHPRGGWVDADGKDEGSPRLRREDLPGTRAGGGQGTRDTRRRPRARARGDPGAR